MTNGNVGIGTWAPGGALVVMNGNVGIGTAAPAQDFHIAHAGTGSLPIIELSDNGTDVSMIGRASKFMSPGGSADLGVTAPGSKIFF